MSLSFVANAGLLAMAGIISRLLGFLYRIPITNWIGDEGNGIYGSAFYIYTFFLILSSAGLPVAISKMVSEKLAHHDYREAHRIFKVTLRASAVSGLIFAILMGMFAQQIADLINNPDSAICIQILSPTLFIISIMSVYRGYFQGMNNFAPTSFSQIIEQIFNAIFSILLGYILVKDSVMLGAAGSTFGTSIGAFAGLIVMIMLYRLASGKIHRQIRKQPRSTRSKLTDLQIVVKLFRTATPIIIGTAIFSITNLIDMVMVQGILMDNGFTAEEATQQYGILVGKYATLITLPISIATAFATAVMPSITQSYTLRKYDEVDDKINTSFRLTMIISVPAAIGLAVLGDPIIQFLYPNAPEGGSLLNYGAIAIIFLALAQITTGMLQGINRVYVPVVAALVGAIIKIPLNSTLIANPELNVLGAVISTMICYAVASIIDVVMLIFTTKSYFDFMHILVKPVFASGIMGLTAFVFYNTLYTMINSNTFAVILAILIAIPMYLFVLLGIGGLKEEDLETIPYGDRIKDTAIEFGFVFHE